MWIDRDHLGWVVLAFSRDADARQADLVREFPEVGAAVVGVDWTMRELERLQDRAVRQLRVVGGGFSVAVSPTRGVVEIWFGVLTPERRAAVERRFSGERVCVDGADPATVPAPGPQPQAGDGWQLLGDAKVGEPYRTGIAADQASYEALWREARMDGIPPPVDLQRSVVLWFGAVYGSSCPGIRLDDVVVDADAALVHALIALPDPPAMCTADARGHAYLVALDRDRLPAPPFRIQLQAGDPPPGAIEEITVVEADLRAPGSVLGPGDAVTASPPAERYVLRSGGVMETGFPAAYLLDARCGVEWLGRLNGIWWRTEVPDGGAAFVPDAWQPEVDAEGMLEVGVVLRQADDPAVPDGQPRVEATLNDVTLVYHATSEAAPDCP